MSGLRLLREQITFSVRKTMSRQRRNQPHPEHDCIPLLWLIVLGTAFVMLTGTILLGVNGVVQTQERSTSEEHTPLRSG